MPDGARRTPDRPVWPIVLLAVVIVPVLVTAVAVLVSRHGIEDKLTSRSQAALAGAGLSQATAHFDGRDARIEDVPAGRERAALDAVRRVHGVRVASVRTRAAPVTPVPATPGVLQVALRSGEIELTGTVSDDTTRAAVRQAATAAGQGRVVNDQLTVRAGTSRVASPAEVGGLVTALGTADGDRAARVENSTVTLTGGTESDSTKADIARKVTAAMPGATVSNQLTVTVQTAQRQVLQQQINQLQAAQPIRFLPNVALLTEGGLRTVQQVADLLSRAGDARVVVRGYVARTPGEAVDPQLLSQQRAMTVQTELIAGMVPADRVTVQGMGYGGPPSANETPEERAQNRRAEIVVG